MANQPVAADTATGAFASSKVEHRFPKTPQMFGWVSLASGGVQATNETALNSWAAAGGNLYLPPLTGGENYLHNGATRPRITTSGTTLRGAGPGQSKITSSVLYDGVNASTDIYLFIIGQGAGAETSDILIDGVGFEFTGPPAARLGASPLLISRVHNIMVQNFRTKYGTFGVLLNRAHNFEITGFEVSHSWADGIQMNNGSDATAGMTCKNGRVHHGFIHDTRDDAVAMGGKQDTSGNRTRVENIEVDNLLIRDITVNGGAVGIYGAAHVSIHHNISINPRSHFFNVLIDNQYDQYPSEDISIEDNINFSDQTAAGGGVSGPVCMWIGGRNTAFSGNELDVPFVKDLRVKRNTFIVNDRSGFWCQPNVTMASHPNKWLNRITLEDNDLIFFGTGNTQDYRGMHFQYIDDLRIKGMRIEGFPNQAAVINQFKKLRWDDNQVAECLADPARSGNSMVTIGDAATATDTITSFAGNNQLRKTSGTANRLLFLRADGSLGAFPYNVVPYSTGATITTAEVTFQSRPTVPFYIGQSGWDKGHPLIQAHHLWVDATNQLRIKGSAPASDTDGSMVGTEDLPINAQTGTTYTLVLADKGKMVTLSNGAAIALTVPSNATAAFPIGAQIHLAQLGAGQVTVSGAGGVTVNGAPGLKLTDQWSSATLWKRATDTWLLIGRLSA